MGKRETKESYEDSKEVRKEAGEDYGKLMESSEQRDNSGLIGSGGFDPGMGGGGGGGGTGLEGGTGPTFGYGSGGFVSPYFGQTGGDYGDVTGGLWTKGSADEGRSSNIKDIRGLYGGLNEASEGSQSAGDQRNALNAGYKNIYENTEKLGTPNNISSGEQQETLGQYKNLRDTGGLSAQNIERMRGMGGYDEFSKTGGYSPEAIANIKAQALSPIGSYATGTRDELQRRQAVQGGYGPGFDAANRQMQRDAARNIAATSLDANVGIQDRINQGRQWGIGNLAAAEGNVAGLQTGNRLAGLAGEAGIGSNLSNISAQDIANRQNTDQFNIQNRQGQQLAGLGGMQGLYEGQMGRGENAYDREFNAQQGALGRGLTASEGAYGRYHTTDENALNRSLSSQESNLDRQFQANQAGLNRAFTGSQISNANRQADYDRQIAILNGQYGNQNTSLGNQSQLGMQPGIGGNIMQGVSAAAGIAGGMMSGGLMPAIGGLSQAAKINM